MLTTSNFCANLLASIIAFMNENNVKVLPLSFLASGNNGFEHSAKIARAFIEYGHCDYFFVKDGALCVHKTYNGYLGLDDCDYEITDGIVTYDSVSRVFGNRNIMNMTTTDLVALVNVAYDTIANSKFNG